MMRWIDAGFRPLLVILLPLSLLSAIAIAGQTSAASHSTSGTSIVQENQKAGSSGWQSAELLAAAQSLQEEEPKQGSSSGTNPTKSMAVSAAYVAQPISGYLSHASINHGEVITLFVSTSLPTYSVDLYRMGWYGGAGARLIESFPGQTGRNQPIPPPDPQTGMVDANWQPSLQIQTGTDWVSGVYLAKLTASDGSVGYAVFVLRDDSSTAGILYQLPVNTWQAYNGWGGKSLYDFNSPNGRAAKVSFNRPYDGTGADGFFNGDLNMIEFLESQGYDVAYATSVDVQANPNLLANHKVFLSNFHDEYWSKQMRDHVTAWRDQGKSLAFFDSNNVYWQVRFEPSAAGVANRTLVCYKDATLDPLAVTNPAQTTVRWRDAPVNQPENTLLGVMYENNWSSWDTSFPWVVQNANSWVYQGTGLKDGDAIPGVVGYEYDKLWGNGQAPANLTVLSNSPVTVNGEQSTSNGVIYQAASGGWVFASGTNYWPWKLMDTAFIQKGADARIQRITTNILDAMIGGAPPAPTPTPSAGGNTYTIYDDALNFSWYDGSWDTTVNMAVTNPVHNGAFAISDTATAGWSGFQLRTDSAPSTAPYTALQFAARSTQDGQRLAVYLTTSTGTHLPIVPLANEGGYPISSAWTVYTIPLADLNAANISLGSIVFHNWSGTAQPPVYLDDIKLINPNSTPTPTATATATATATSTSTPTPTATAPTTPAPDSIFTVYDDALASGWWDQSWSATVNFANTNPRYSGANSISYTATAGWAGLDLHAGGGLSTAPYTQLRLAVQASQANQKFAVYLRNSSGAALTKVPLANYGGTPPAGSWKVYTIPLSDLGATNVTLGDVVVHEWSGSAQPAIYVDSIQLLGNSGGGTPTPTPTPSPTATPSPTPSPTTTPSPTPSPTATPSGSRSIYDDALATGWYTSLSWDATINTANSSPVYSGTKSISYTATAGWAGLQLRNDGNVSTAPYTHLRLAVRATQDGERFAIYLRDSNYTSLKSPVPLANYGGYPIAGGWTVYTIPLADLNASNVSLGSIVIHNWSGAAQPAIYVDSIELVSQP